MTIQKLFCPKCGNITETLIESLCSICYNNKIFNQLKIPNILKISLCNDCNSFLNNNKWEKYDSINDVISKIIFQSIKKENKLLSININNYEKITDFLYSVTIEYGINIYKSKKIEIRIKYIQCNTCNKINGGYFESIIQCRFISSSKNDNRNKIDNIINSLIEKYKKNGDKYSFISKIFSNKHGIDYYIGSTNIAKKISKILSNKFILSYKESYTLIGIKNSKKLYRTTIALKFSSINNGDIFYFKNNIIMIDNLYTKSIIKNLENYSQMSIDIIDIEKKGIYLGNKYNDYTNAIITYIEKEIIILDLETYNTFSIKKLSCFNFKNGDNIHIFKCSYGTFII